MDIDRYRNREADQAWEQPLGARVSSAIARERAREATHARYVRDLSQLITDVGQQQRYEEGRRTHERSRLRRSRNPEVSTDALCQHLAEVAKQSSAELADIQKEVKEMRREFEASEADRFFQSIFPCMEDVEKKLHAGLGKPMHVKIGEAIRSEDRYNPVGVQRRAPEQRDMKRPENNPALRCATPGVLLLALLFRHVHSPPWLTQLCRVIRLAPLSCPPCVPFTLLSEADGRRKERNQRSSRSALTSDLFDATPAKEKS